MKKSKLLIMLLVISAMLISLCGCSNGGSSSSSGQSASRNANFEPQTHRIAAGATSTAALLKDGTVLCTLDKGGDENISVNGEWKEWNDVVDISMNEEILAAVKSDGTVVWCGGRVKEYDWLTDSEVMGEIDSWKNIVQVSASEYDIAALSSDGSVKVTGLMWTDNLEEKEGFTQVSVYNALLCLRKDGTVYCYAPYTLDGQTWSYDVSGWKDVTQVSAGWDHAAALKADGTVVATGNNDKGQCNTSGWSDIVQVCAGRKHTIGLKSDGTVVFCGDPPYGCSADFLSGWTDIVEISGFFNEVMGLKKDGSLVYAGSANFHNPVDAANIN